MYYAVGVFKKEESPYLMFTVRNEKGDIIRNQLTFGATKMSMKSYVDAADFAATYPFIPYQFQLLQKIQLVFLIQVKLARQWLLVNFLMELYLIVPFLVVRQLLVLKQLSKAGKREFRMHGSS